MSYKAYEKNLTKQKRLKELTSQVTINLAFLLDCTSSMEASIENAKEKIQSIVEESKERFGGQMKIAFIGYRDYCDTNKIERLEFTDSVDKFKEFVGNVKDSGGGDTCEDVIGGLKEVLYLEWEERSQRILIHIADAPSHGSRFHSYSNQIEDNYMETTYKDPKTETPIENIIEDMKNKKISDFFGELHESTRKMINEFNKIGGKDFVKCAPMKSLNMATLAIMAISTVLDQSWHTTMKREKVLNQFLETHVMKIEEKGEVKSRRFEIDEMVPDWETCEEKRVKIFTCVIEKDRRISKPIIKWEPKLDTFKIGKMPFSKGTERLAYYCRFGSDSTPNPVTMVAKALIRQTDGIDLSLIHI